MVTNSMDLINGMPGVVPDPYPPAVIPLTAFEQDCLPCVVTVESPKLTEFPFEEELLEENENYTLVKRVFNKDLDSKELIWHRDKEDREIKLISGQDWYIQFENELPVLIEKNDLIKIRKQTWHRIINKKYTKLVIEIKKYKY